MAQTPQQRRANEKFAKHEASKHGKPKTITSKHSPKPSLSAGWVALLAFVVCGGLLFELLRVVPELWLAETTDGLTQPYPPLHLRQQSGSNHYNHKSFAGIDRPGYNYAGRADYLNPRN